MYRHVSIEDNSSMYITMARRVPEYLVGVIWMEFEISTLENASKFDEKCTMTYNSLRFIWKCFKK
jgi:hypothetical protein